MSPAVGFALAVLGVLLGYEALQLIQKRPPVAQASPQSPQGNTTGNTVGPLSGNLTVPAAGGFLHGLPSGWFQALFANESTLPSPGSPGGPWPAFGISDPSGIHPGPGINGTNVFRSQAAPGHTPPLRLFNSMDEAVSSLFNDVLSSPRYASAIAYGQSNPGDCVGFFTRLGNAGYASPSDMAAGWPQQVCSRVHG